MKTFLRNNSLSIVVFLLFLLFLAGETATGYLAKNQDLEEHRQPTQSLTEYMRGGDYIEGVFENWESEFLQMGSYVFLTVWLRQKGSAESKKLEGTENTDREPQKTRNGDAPWPVRRGGWVLKLYENSLGLAFLLLFLLSFSLHAYGGAQAACEENQLHGEQCTSTVGFLGTSEFWYQSFQNWQSEFLAVFAIVVLSIWLRQKGSPESKPVNTPHSATGS
jgi:hypothetical protein